MNCKYCGQQLDDDKKYCTNCGASVDNPIPQMTSPMTPDSPMTLPQNLGKKGIVKKRTVYFWAAKAALAVTLILFFMPFISFDYHGLLIRGSTDELVMTGKELIFGNEDGNDGDSKGTAKGSLSSGTVTIAGIMIAIALVLPAGGTYLSGAGAYFLFRFARNADKSYTFKDKPIRDWDKNVLELHIHAALYIAIVLLIAATVLAAVDTYKRKKQYQQELVSTLNGGYGYF